MIVTKGMCKFLTVSKIVLGEGEQAGGQRTFAEPPGGTPYSLVGGVPLGSRKSYPLLVEQILQILWPYTRLKTLTYSWFQSFVSNLVKRNPILDHFSMIIRPYTRLNGLKTIPFPAAYTRIANIWEYPFPPRAPTTFYVCLKGLTV